MSFGISMRLNDLNDVSTAGADNGDVLTKVTGGFKFSAPQSAVAPADEIIYGTGTGATSSSTLTYNPSTWLLSIIGGANSKMRVHSSSAAAYFETKNASNEWQMIGNSGDFYVEPNVANGVVQIRNLANTTLYRLDTGTGVARYLTGTTVRVEGKGTTALQLAAYDTNEALTSISRDGFIEISSGTLRLDTADLKTTLLDVRYPTKNAAAFNAPIGLKGYTVATLPVSPATGSMAYVTDATLPTYLGTLTGGGSVVTPVFYNGVSWVSH